MPIAYVSLRRNIKISENELINFVAERIGERAATPKNIYFIDTMPLTSVGKIYKPALRIDLLRRLSEENQIQ